MVSSQTSFLDLTTHWMAWRMLTAFTNSEVQRSSAIRANTYRKFFSVYDHLKALSYSSIQWLLARSNVLEKKHNFDVCFFSSHVFWVQRCVIHKKHYISTLFYHLTRKLPKIFSIISTYVQDFKFKNKRFEQIFCSTRFTKTSKVV